MGLRPGRELETFQTLANVGEEARLGEFSVSDDVDAAVDLLAHHFSNRLAHRVLICLLVIRLPGIFRLHHVEQLARPRQAADVSRLDAIGILLELHGAFSPGAMRRLVAAFLNDGGQDAMLC